MDALEVLDRELARVQVSVVGDNATLTIPKTLVASIAAGNVTFRENGVPFTPTIINDDPVIGWYFRDPEDVCSEDRLSAEMYLRNNAYIEYLDTDGQYKKISSGAVLPEKVTVRVMLPDNDYVQSIDKVYIDVECSAEDLVWRLGYGGGVETTLNTPVEIVLPDPESWAPNTWLFVSGVGKVSPACDVECDFSQTYKVEKAGSIMGTPVIEPYLFSMYKDGTLTASLEGHDAKGNDLEYSNWSSPARGVLTWEDDTTFKYEHSGVAGEVNFDIRAFNGARVSEWEDVTIDVFDNRVKLFNFENGFNGSGEVYMRSEDAKEGHKYIMPRQSWSGVTRNVILNDTMKMGDARLSLLHKVIYPGAHGSECAFIEYNGIELSVKRRDYGAGGYDLVDGSDNVVLSDYTNGGTWDELVLEIDMDSNKYRASCAGEVSALMDFTPNTHGGAGSDLTLRRFTYALSTEWAYFDYVRVENASYSF